MAQPPTTTTITTATPSAIDPNNGYCPTTKTFHSLRQTPPLPPPTTPLTITQYILSLLHSSPSPSFSPTTTPVFITTTSTITYSTFLHQLSSLTSSLSTLLPPNSTALILSPPTQHLPLLFLSLLSLNITVSPANPLSTPSELTHLINLIHPTIIFSHSSIPFPSSPLPTILLDSLDFQTMITHPPPPTTPPIPRPPVSQHDTATILFSSGTTGRVKGAILTHRNFISLLSGLVHRQHTQQQQDQNQSTPISLMTIPMFHVFGFFMMLRAVALGETLVLMERFDFEKMLMGIQKYKITYMPVSPPLIVAMCKSQLVDKYDLSSLEALGCGGAPLGKEVAQRFKARFPDVEIIQGYGLTETGGGASSTAEPEECERYGSVGRLSEFMEAKIVDPSTGEALPPGQKGELWLRGPTVMKGYVGDEEATSATILPDGWLRTGDLCYFDSDGFLYIVDRLKELIKYKGYQVPPAELERLLLSHPEIADAAVIPYPDEDAGQIPMAFIVRKPESTITGPQVMDYVAKQVSPYKKIRRVSFVNNIPKNPSGKILRKDLVSQVVAAPSKL